MQYKRLYQIGFMALFLYTGAAQGQVSDALGTMTPYSMFGLGELVRQGTTYNRTMGGIGLSLRDHRYINYLNPAAISAHDTLAFMLDFGLEAQNFYHASNQTKSAFNSMNMNHFVISFPVYKKSAVVVGFAPYSHVGYRFEVKESRPEIISEMGDVTYQHYGEGSMNQIFIGAAVSLSKNFSVGAKGIYNFGTLSRSSNVLFNTVDTYNPIATNAKTVLESFAGKFGVQYEGRLNRRTALSVGATALLPTTLKGDVSRVATSISGSSVVDTVYSVVLNGSQISVPAEYAAGVSLSRKYVEGVAINRWLVGFDYSYQDWSNTNFAPTPGVNFAPSVKSAYKFGFELTPDFFDSRYAFKRWTYRGGVYYEDSYVKLNGQQVNSRGVTFGLSLPVYRGYNKNMLNFGVDLGQRGTLKEQLIRERYVLFQISISLYDIWFVKMRYE